jgi:hypothetical protein
MAKSKSRPRLPTRAEGPAIETPLHVWNRPAVDDEMRPITGKVACTKWTPLEAAYEQSRLGEKNSVEAVNRLNAGRHYAKIYALADPKRTDSTQRLNITRGVFTGGMSAEVADAKNLLAVVKSHLGARDRIIIDKVCGEEMYPSEAVAMVSTDYAKSTGVRFRESLDALIEAFETARREPGRVRL